MTTADDSAFIVQVFTTFAAPELNPLLLRLDQDTTVTAAIDAALSKLLQHQALATLPSDAAADYKMSMAGGDGYPARGAQPFLPTSILRNLAGLEFPYMLHVGYHPAASAAAAGDARDGDVSYNASLANASAAGGKDGAPLWGNNSQQQVLSAAEKEALARRRNDVERKREENLLAIERRRADSERNAYQHAESYEVYRQDKIKRQEEQAEAQRLMAEAKEEALQLAKAAAAGDDGGSEEDAAAQSKRVLNQHRLEMLRRVEEEKQRAIELAAFREQRRVELEAKQQQLLREKRRLLQEQQGARMENALQDILGQLDEKVGLNLSNTDKTFTDAKLKRKELERTEADLRSIATLETIRNEPKIAARAHRSNIAASTAQLQLRYTSQQGAVDSSRELDVAKEQQRWRQQQEDKQAALESHLELHYRTVFDTSAAASAAGGTSHNASH